MSFLKCFLVVRSGIGYKSTVLQFRCCISQCQVVSGAKRTHYETLGVELDASKKDIRTAFISLSKKHHPDISKSKNAHEQFSQINEAYHILYNTVRRRQYDWQLTHQSTNNSYASAHNTPYTSYYYNTGEENWSKVYEHRLRRKNHTPLVVGLLVFMVVGSAIQLFRIQYSHKRQQQRSLQRHRKNLEIYNEVIERGKNTSLEELVKRLSEKPK